MARGTFVFRGGKCVPKEEAGPLTPRGPRSGLSAPMYIGDGMEAQSMFDGRMYTSKSKYRAELRARNLVEVGNEKLRGPSGPIAKPTGVKDDIRRAISELS